VNESGHRETVVDILCYWGTRAEVSGLEPELKRPKLFRLPITAYLMEPLPGAVPGPPALQGRGRELRAAA
jgi:hypothetical protein